MIEKKKLKLFTITISYLLNLDLKIVNRNNGSGKTGRWEMTVKDNVYLKWVNREAMSSTE